MAIRRYSRSPQLALGTRYGTSDAIVKIRQGISLGILQVKTVVLAQGQRLDTVAGDEYGDGSLWWVIAAASNIGWSPQVPPGTILSVPTNISAVAQALAT
jgi:hypothetical protein